jgi:hypothetical protein
MIGSMSQNILFYFGVSLLKFICIGHYTYSNECVLYALREPLCHVDKEPPIYLDAVKPDSHAGPPSPATFLDSHEDYADIWLPGGDDPAGALTSSGGYRTLSGESARRGMMAA